MGAIGCKVRRAIQIALMIGRMMENCRSTNMPLTGCMATTAHRAIHIILSMIVYWVGAGVIAWSPLVGRIARRAQLTLEHCHWNIDIRIKAERHGRAERSWRS